jgi:hypothetical protein
MYLIEWIDDLDGNADLVICPRGMLLPLLKDVQCGSLSNHIDKTLVTLGGALLHEYVHWWHLMRKTLQLKTSPQERIGDFKGPDLENGYGPYRVLKVKKKADPKDNADNFRFFATEAYWHRICRLKSEQYGPGREGEPGCNTEGRRDFGEDCHPV